MTKKEQAEKQFDKAKEQAKNEVDSAQKHVDKADEKVKNFEKKAKEAEEKAKDADSTIEEKVEKERSRFYKAAAAIWERIKSVYVKIKEFLASIWNKILSLFKKKTKVAAHVDDLKKQLKALKKVGGGSKPSTIERKIKDSSMMFNDNLERAVRNYKKAEQISDLIDDKILALKYSKVKGKKRLMAILEKHREKYDDIVGDYGKYIREVQEHLERR